MHAVDLFPEAASSNHRIFHPETCAPRTVNEVYALFGAKLSNRRFEQLEMRSLNAQSGSQQVPRARTVSNKTAAPYQWEKGRAL